MTGLLEEIADAMHVHEDDQRVAQGRVIAHARMDDAKRRTVPARSRRVRRAWLVPTVATLVVLGGGAAIAQTTGLADRVLGSREPAVDRIGVLREDGRTMTREELRMLFGSDDVRRQIGEQILGDRGQRVVENDRIRVGAVATASGGVCTVVSEWDDGTGWPTSGWHSGAAGCGAFQDGWPLMDASGARGSAGLVFSYGLVADGVAQVRFLVGSDVHGAKMGRSGYLWVHPDGVRVPDAIQAVLDDGTIVQREYPPHGVFQPPTDPHVVGNVNDEP